MSRKEEEIDLKKIFLNREAIGENLELINADSCYVLVTQDERTVALNEVAAFILEHCENKSVQEIISVLREICDPCSLTVEFEDDIKTFIKELEEQELIFFR